MAMKLLLDCLVVAVRDEAAGVRSFFLKHRTRDELPPFEPGAHVTVRMPGGLRRSYSLSGDPATRSQWRITVQSEPKGLGGSLCMHRDVQAGDRLHVTYPDNRFALVDAPRYTLIGAGIGVTPLVAMAHELHRRGRPFRFVYCARNRLRAPLLAELQALCPPEQLHLQWSSEPGGTPGTGGRLDLEAELGRTARDTAVYVCGPGAMLDQARALGATLGLNVITEAFQGLSVEAARQGQAFEIQLRSSGRVLAVPETRSALDVLREAGEAIESQCEGGACGTCAVGYVAGEPVHRDTVLHPRDRAHRFITCVSRGKGCVTLDL